MRMRRTRCLTHAARDSADNHLMLHGISFLFLAAISSQCLIVRHRVVTCDRFVNLALGYCVNVRHCDQHPHHDQQGEKRPGSRSHSRKLLQPVIKERKRERGKQEFPYSVSPRSHSGLSATISRYSSCAIIEGNKLFANKKKRVLSQHWALCHHHPLLTTSVQLIEWDWTVNSSCMKFVASQIGADRAAVLVAH